METETKPVTQSKTLWGIGLTVLAAGIPLAAKYLGFSISDVDVQTIVDGVTAVGVAIGALVAVYGRVTATKTIG